MVNVRIDENTLLNMLMERVEQWNNTETALDLYEKMYESEIAAGCFEGAEIDVNLIVDNDVINCCYIVEEGEKEFNSILQLYKEQGLGDISMESHYSFIEAVDDENKPKAFLVRY
jgi:hypothetical protein